MDNGLSSVYTKALTQIRTNLEYIGVLQVYLLFRCEL